MLLLSAPPGRLSGTCLSSFFPFRASGSARAKRQGMLRGEPAPQQLLVRMRGRGASFLPFFAGLSRALRVFPPRLVNFTPAVELSRHLSATPVFICQLFRMPFFVTLCMSSLWVCCPRIPATGLTSTRHYGGDDSAPQAVFFSLPGALLLLSWCGR